MFSCYFNPIQVTIFNILFRHLIGSTDTQPINIFYNTSAPVGNAIFDHMTVTASELSQCLVVKVECTEMS